MLNNRTNSTDDIFSDIGKLVFFGALFYSAIVVGVVMNRRIKDKAVHDEYLLLRQSYDGLSPNDY
jgi:hypothetical protein